VVIEVDVGSSTYWIFIGLALGGGDHVFGAEVKVVESDAACPMFFHSGNGPPRRDLLALVTAG